MSYIKFNQVLDELDSILRSNEKRAEELTDDNVLSGNLRDLEGQGEKIPKKKQLEHASNTDTGTPTDSDSVTKSVDFQVPSPDSDEIKVYKSDLDAEAEKSAKLGNKILADLYRMLGKRAADEEMITEPASEEEAEEETVRQQAEEPEEGEEEIPEEVVNELPEPTPEDAEVLDALGAKTASDASIYLLSKQAGMNFADELMANILSGPVINSLVEKQASYLAGIKLAELEQGGAIIGMEKTASLAQNAYMKGYTDAVNGLPANP